MEKKEIVVIGASKFGTEIINKIKTLPAYNIIVIDRDENKLRKIEGVDSYYVGDATEEKLLDDIGLNSADVFVIGVSSDIQSSLLIASLLKSKYKGKIIAKGENDNHEKILRQLGVHSIINTERTAARRAIIQIVNPMAGEKIRNEIIQLDGGISMVRVPAEPEFFGKEIKNIGTLKTTIVMVYRDGKPMMVTGSTVIGEGDEIVYLGENKIILDIVASSTFGEEKTAEIDKKGIFNRNN